MGFLPFSILTAASNKGPSGQQVFTTSGTFTVPQGVKKISVVCVAGGGGGFVSATTDLAAGGGGAGLSYAESIDVIPGETYSVVVGAAGQGVTSGGSGKAGGDSYFSSSGELLAEGANELGGSGSGSLRTGGGNGGRATKFAGNINRASGGGAAGYTGNGGNANDEDADLPPQDGSGGGGAGAGDLNNDQNGGGVGLNGQGANGIAPGGAGSGGSGTTYGGGGSGDGFNKDVRDGGPGGVRIIWGHKRFYPSTNTEDV